MLTRPNLGIQAMGILARLRLAKILIIARPNAPDMEYQTAYINTAYLLYSPRLAVFPVLKNMCAASLGNVCKLRKQKDTYKNCLERTSDNWNFFSSD